MWRILFQNLWLKLVALLMALLLWFHVATDKIYEHTESFPLEIFNVPERLILAEKLPAQVNVRIRGKGKELLKLLLAEKTSLKIDAEKFKRGETNYEIKPQQIPIPEGLELAVTDIILPPKLKIRLDYPMEKKVRVQPHIKISPAEGFKGVGELHYTPEKVSISGPRMWVRNLRVIHTEERTIEDAKESISDQVDLIPPEGYNITISPQRISFSQTIEKIQERKISNLPIELINIPKYRKVKLEQDSISVIISGAGSVVNQVTPDQIKIRVNCAGVKRNQKVKLPIQVKMKAKVQLKKVEPDSVWVSVK